MSMYLDTHARTHVTGHEFCLTGLVHRLDVLWCIRRLNGSHMACWTILEVTDDQWEVIGEMVKV